MPDVDQQNSVDIAVKTTLMVGSAQHGALGLVEQRVHPIPKLSTVPFAAFQREITQQSTIITEIRSDF
jgi:hypothetical protein